MNNNIYFVYTPNNKKNINLLIQKGIISKDNVNTLPAIDVKIYHKNNTHIFIGFGIYSNVLPTYNENNSKIKWVSLPTGHIPDNQFNNSINQIIKFDITSLNKDFVLKKRTPIFPSINDDIILKINPNYKNDKLLPAYIKNIIDNIEDLNKEGLSCKLLTYNLWIPSSIIENKDENDIVINVSKTIPGSIILGSGKWNKYKIPFNKSANQYELLSYNFFPIDDFSKKNIDNNYIFYINNIDLFYFNFYILK